MSALTTKQRHTISLALTEISAVAKLVRHLHPDSEAVVSRMVSTCRRAANRYDTSVTVEDVERSLVGLQRLCVTLGPGAQERIAALVEPLLGCLVQSRYDPQRPTLFVG